ncbi:MAG: 3-phosphoglycerate dehydrogenase [Saprospiraceae bacterium]|jgi:D-3-phosphoglycerate dehydrogenase|nr:3-phosphoglycerate dehydrogenase [Saprospiraceae bacterium]MBK8296460.1 3-phosphoglycerate dehydrogenase [Saprospiraceae bacterium]
MSWKILVTDGLEESGISALKSHGFTVDLKKLEAAELPNNLIHYQGIIVRSATKIRQDLIKSCPNLKFIARAGVGMDNIDVDAARAQGIKVINTPASSSRSVAELSMAHIYNLSRNLQLSNRNLKDKSSFVELKKSLSKATELKGKTLLIIGMGRIGRELGLLALGSGMQILAHDPFINQLSLNFELQGQSILIPVSLVSLEEGLPEADYISMHSPFDGNQILTPARFAIMKKNACVINTSRGENLDEVALLNALDSDQLAGAGLDVFQNEPEVNPLLLNHPKISVSPHIGASTLDAQQRIAEELVTQIVSLYEQSCDE